VDRYVCQITWEGEGPTVVQRFRIKSSDLEKAADEVAAISLFAEDPITISNPMNRHASIVSLTVSEGEWLAAEEHFFV
jgi:hypothetical protein